jgi:hypothetical protein
MKSNEIEAKIHQYTKNTTDGSRSRRVGIFDVITTMVERVMTVVRLTAHGREQNIWFGKFKLPAVTRLKVQTGLPSRN